MVLSLLSMVLSILFISCPVSIHSFFQSVFANIDLWSETTEGGMWKRLSMQSFLIMISLELEFMPAITRRVRRRVSISAVSFSEPLGTYNQSRIDSEAIKIVSHGALWWLQSTVVPRVTIDGRVPAQKFNLNYLSEFSTFPAYHWQLEGHLRMCRTPGNIETWHAKTIDCRWLSKVALSPSHGVYVSGMR